ncbi:MAG: aminotransferase class III-fold pyridoxal phosphate-dependent enzyme [Rhizobiales bacterium]|nr:aminotransferase class III-fold pyridoxal phosphate-dependent enzyme [Hyphomicrobiales bacterium]
MNQQNNLSVNQQDIKFHLHSQTNPVLHETTGAMVFTHGENCHVFEKGGRKLIDAMAGLWCASLGFSNERLAKVAADQYKKFGFYHTFNHKMPEIVGNLAEKLASMSPIKNAKVYFATSGSEAIETMVKLSWMHFASKGQPNKRKIITRERAFHGSTIVAASMCGLPRMQREFGLPLPGFLHTTCPDFYRNAKVDETESEFVIRLAKELENLILAEDPNTIAAFAAEPINAGGGIVVPPKGYFDEIHKILMKYDILCLDDEIVCGFGRTGKMFGCELVGMEPDMIALAKGLSSSYFPISAVLISDEIYNSLKKINNDGSLFGHGFTNSGHPVGAAIVLETLAIYEEMNVVDHVQKMGKALKDGLKKIAKRSTIIGQVRGEGLMLGVELVSDLESKLPFNPKLQVGAEFDRRAMKNNLIIRAMGDTIGFCPPLIIELADIQEILELFEKTLIEIEGWLMKVQSENITG